MKSIAQVKPLFCECGCGEIIQSSEAHKHISKRGLMFAFYECMETYYAGEIPDDEDFRN